MADLRDLVAEANCYLTTTGRRTGRPHTIEIWFAAGANPQTLYLLAGNGDRSDWVRNILRYPEVTVRIGALIFQGQGRVVDDPAEERLARQVVVKKYYGRDTVATTGWEATALPVALDLSM
jgi:deazaflavin-dependent oxidoreductase (nitroreductase family)